MTVRRMEAGDLSCVAGLEKKCFSDPWSEKTIAEGLNGRWDTFWVLEEGGSVCGYCCLRILAGEGEIHRIAVEPDRRGGGYGRKLMDTMAVFARENGVRAVSLEVRKSNEAAVKLYKSCNFETEAVRKSYYSDPTEDALIMWARDI